MSIIIEVWCILLFKKEKKNYLTHLKNASICRDLYFFFFRWYIYLFLFKYGGVLIYGIGFMIFLIFLLSSQDTNWFLVVVIRKESISIEFSNSVLFLVIDQEYIDSLW